MINPQDGDILIYILYNQICFWKYIGNHNGIYLGISTFKNPSKVRHKGDISNLNWETCTGTWKIITKEEFNEIKAKLL